MSTFPSFLTRYASVILFYFFLALIFLLEGLGLNGGRDAALALIIVMPLFLFALDFIQHMKNSVPRPLSLLYGGFLLSSVIATCFSINVLHSLPYLLFYISLGITILYVYNHQEEIRRIMVPFLFIFSFIFLAASLIVWYVLFPHNPSFYPQNGYQFIFSRFGYHNHLGDFLVLPMLISIYYFLTGKHLKLALTSVLLSVPFFLSSYSRSAYLSFILATSVLLIGEYKKVKYVLRYIRVLLVVCLLLFIGVFFFATIQEDQAVPLLDEVQIQLTQLIPTHVKSLSAHRPDFFAAAFSSIVKKPFFGVGPGNYLTISQRYSSSLLGYATDSSHNLFLDICSENGVIAGVFFLLFIVLLFIKAKKESVFFYLSIAMLINFQTDYTFRIYSFFLLFFILLILAFKSGPQEKL